MANTTDQINVAITADPSGLVSGFQQATASTDQLGSSMQSFMAQGRALDDMLATQAKSLDDVANRQKAYSDALRTGLLSQSEYAAATKTLQGEAGKLFDQFGKAAPSINAATTATQGLITVTAGAQREIGVLAGELARGNTAQFEKSLITLTRQTGLLQAAMSPAGAAVGAFVAVLGGIVGAIVEAADEEDAFNKALILTGGYAQLTTEQLTQQVTVIGQATGQYSAAQEALTKLAASGKLTGTTLENAAQGVVAFAQLTGKSIDDSVKEFEKIGDSSIPQLLKLNDTYHFLNGSIVDQISALEQQGDTIDAARLKEDAFADAMIDRAADYNATLSGFAGLWRDVKSGIDGAWNSAKDFLSTASSQAFQQAMTVALGPLLGPIYAQQQAARDADAASAKAHAAATREESAANQVLSDFLAQSNAALDSQTVSLDKQVAVYGKGHVGAVQFTIDQQLQAAASKLSGQALIDATNEILDHGDQALAAAQKLDQLVAAHKRHGDAAKQDAALARELDAAMDSLEETVTSLAAQMSGPAEAAEARYLATLTKLQNEAEKAAIAGGDVNQILDEWQQGEENAAAALERTLEQLDRQNDFLGKMAEQWREDERLVGLDGDAHQVMEDVIKAETEARNLYYQGLRDSPELLDSERAAVIAGSTAHHQFMTTVEQSRQVQQQFVQTFVSGFNSLADTIGQFFSGQLNGWTDFGSKLVDIAKQIVGSIISQFAKLAVINPILNAVFGGTAGFSLLPTLGNAVAGLGGGGAAAAAGGASGGGDLFGTASGGISLFNAGKTIWDGFSTGYSNFLYGSQYNPASANFMGPPVAGQQFGPQYGGYASGFGQALGIAGGVYAGYNEYNRAGGGVAGLAGGAAYGVGTYVVGAGLSSAAAGTGAMAGLGALGPIGWIALAAMLIDMASGGKLFGTAGKVVGGNQTVSTGPGGIDISSVITTKGQHALFGGSYWKEHNVATDPAVQQAWDNYFDGVTSGLKIYATQWGAAVPQLLASTFQQTFDKHGNVTGSTTTIGGHTYSGDTVQQYQQRYVDENELTVLDEFDSKLDATIDKYRGNVDVLTGLVAGLSNAETMFKAGENFLALGSDQTLSSLLKLASGMQQVGETIDQTIARIEQAQAQYDQFVGQFKPAPTFASDFQATLAGIDAQMNQNIATANALARAAGAEGASETDLTNIHKYAAQQFAQAVAQLKASANSLAASLGYALPNNLDDINSEISELEAKANSGGHALSGFGDAMHTVAQRAIDAMNLMLGDLSPYNDQQKLALALQGQQAGTVTPQQVLEIGRRLYATGSDYTALFNQVMSIGDHTQHGGTGAGSSGGGGGGLSASDQQRLNDLKQQRDQMEAQQRHADALKLAQQVADLAASTGESIDQALKDVGIEDIGPFMKDLGLSNSKDFYDLITKLEKNTDSAGDNTQQIASRLDLTNTLLTQIRDGTTGAAAGENHGGHAMPTRGDMDRNTQALNDNTDSNRELARSGGGIGGPGQIPGSRSTRGSDANLQRVR